HRPGRGRAADHLDVRRETDLLLGDLEREVLLEVRRGGNLANDVLHDDFPRQVLGVRDTSQDDRGIRGQTESCLGVVHARQLVQHSAHTDGRYESVVDNDTVRHERVRSWDVEVIDLVYARRLDGAHP